MVIIWWLCCWHANSDSIIKSVCCKTVPTAFTFSFSKIMGRAFLEFFFSLILSACSFSHLLSAIVSYSLLLIFLLLDDSILFFHYIGVKCVLSVHCYHIDYLIFFSVSLETSIKRITWNEVEKIRRKKNSIHTYDFKYCASILQLPSLLLFFVVLVFICFRN